MTDITEAPTQDAIAESLLPEETSSAAEATGTETVEQGEFQPESAEQVEAQPEETAEDWLPSDQDKVFTDDVLLRYAERYQKDQQWLSDPLNRQLLVDKLNSDIYLRQQQEEQQFLQEPEQEQVAEPTREPQIPTREQWFQQIDQVVQQTTDPEVAKAFHSDFLRAFGVPEAQIAKMPPQQAMQFTQTASKYMLNLISTHLPNMLQAQLSSQIAQAFPGFGDMYERSAHALQWDKVRNSHPQFSSLPPYGTKEFQKTLRDAADRVPEVAEMIDEASGHPMNPAQVGRWYTMLARIASGQNVDPALLQRAAAAGAANQRRAAVRRSAGNLGSGQSKAASQSTRSSSQFQSNQDIFDDETMELWEREHGRL